MPIYPPRFCRYVDGGRHPQDRLLRAALFLILRLVTRAYNYTNS